MAEHQLTQAEAVARTVTTLLSNPTAQEAFFLLLRHLAGLDSELTEEDRLDGCSGCDVASSANHAQYAALAVALSDLLRRDTAVQAALDCCLAGLFGTGVLRGPMPSPEP